MAKILVVDDDVTVQVVLRNLLESESHEVWLAPDGKQAMQLANTIRPDVIICDWMMPRLDGLELCRQVKASPELATTFFILLSARGEVDDRVKGLDAGADEFLSKPIETEELLARVRAGWRSRRLTQKLSRANQHLAALVEVQRRLLAFKSDGSAGESVAHLYRELLELLGQAAGASRAYIVKTRCFESVPFPEKTVESCFRQNGAGHHPIAEKSCTSFLLAQWKAPALNSHQTIPPFTETAEPPVFPFHLPSRWNGALQRGDIISLTAGELPPEERIILEQLGILSLLILPMTVKTELFGFIALEKCDSASPWEAKEIAILQAAAAAMSLHQERQNAAEALRFSEARYRAIVEDQTELICRFQPDGTLTFVNEAYCRYFGVKREEAIGKALVPLVLDRQRDADRNPVITREQRVILPSGEIRTHQWTERAIFDGKGRFIEFQAVGRDITDRKRAEEETLKALAKEKELGELKTRFISMVSHEFRTPLSTILSSADLLEYYVENSALQRKERQLEHLKRIQNAAVNMTELLEDVLFMGRTDAGKQEFKPVPLDLIEFCRQLVDDLQIAVFRDRTIEFVYPPHFNPRDRACMDEKLLRQILTNLMSNAIKYSPSHPSIRLELNFMKIDQYPFKNNPASNPLIPHSSLLVDSDCAAVFRIWDAGIGIPKEDIPHLFESFHRGKNVGNIAGTGLGLAIVKRCVDLHGGHIDINSEVGSGTTFTVTLPLHPPES